MPLATKEEKKVMKKEMAEYMDKSKLEEDELTYKVAIRQCANLNQPQRTVRLLVEMQDRKLIPDAETCTSVISSCERGTQWAMALHLIRDMANISVEPHVDAYTAAIR